MLRQFSRTQRWIAFALLLLLGLTLFTSLHLDLLNASMQLGEAITGEENEENEAAIIAEYFKYRFNQMKDKSGKIPDGALIGALNARQALVARQTGSASGGVVPMAAGIDNLSWTFAGPGNVGGRIRAILPINASTILIGSVSGGLWKTTNCCSTNTTWTPVDDWMANLAISSLIVDPTNANVMYAGTGEGFGNADGIRGAGVFKSTNGGTTWSQLASTNSADWYYVNRLAISPNGATLLAGTNTNLFRSTNGGGSWQAKLNGIIQDVKFDPSNSDNAIATAKDVAFYSTDGGATWNNATGLPTGGRKELAYAPSAPATVYVSMENGAIYKSTDGGQSYAQVNANAGHQVDQGWYDNTIWVNPNNSNNLIVGGLDLYQSTDGGTSFTKISDWTQSWPDAASPHADHHALVSIPGSSTALLNGNDGGLYYTADVTTVGNAPTYTNGWVNLNNNLGLTQFFGVAGNSNGVLYGGAQDNGVVRGTAANPNAWTYANGGDGGKSAADPTNPNYLYNEYIYGKVNRSSDGGATSQDIFGSYYDGTNWTCRPAPYRIDDACNSQGSFIAPILLDPNNAERLLVGDLSLWVTIDARTPHVWDSPTGGPQWAAIKSSTGSGINAIAVAPSNSNVIWVGYEDGRIDMTTNGGTTWTQVDTNIGGNHPGTGVGSIAIDRNNSNIVYVGFWGFGPDRVWRTADGGATWTSITNNLPDAPVYAVAINPTNSAWLYVGTEIGVFASENTGASWNVPTGTGRNGDGPANVPVFDLQWKNGGNSTGQTTLIAGTHGRGAWTANTNPITTGTIIIRKATSPAGGTGFGFTSNIPGAANFTLDHGQNQTVNNVTAGSYTVTENAPSGYSLTNLVCTDPTNNSTGNLGTRTATINLAAGETVDCTFTNTQNAPTTGTIIIRKTTSPAGGTGFGFTSTIPGAANFTLNHGQNLTVNSVTAGSYTVTENAPSGYSLTNLVCTDPTNNSTGNLGTRTATINLAAGETVDCTFTNTQNAPTTGTIIIRKATSPAGGTGFGFTSTIPGAASFTLNHGQNLTVNSVTAGSYTVTENAPSGYSLTNLVCTDPTNNSTGNLGTRTATINLAAGETVDCTFTNTQSSTTPTIVISSDSNGSVPGLSFRDEDIIAYNPTTRQWSLVFDGSDVGVGNVDVDGFAFLANGHLLLSVDKDFTLSGFGAVDESDILEFIPSSYGPTTSGRYQMYFDGSDVGLDKSDEDVDAIDFDASGNLLVSVDGAFNAQTVKGADEDLFKLSGFTSGANTSGTWSLYFDGSDVSLSSSGEDIFGLWADHANSKLYLTTRDNFSVPGASGDEDDIFVCRYTSLGANTACTFSLFWNGDTVGFNQDAIDGLSIGTPPAVVSAADSGDSTTVDDTVEYAGDDANEPNPLDGEETTDEAVQNNRILLPLITR